MNYADTPPVDYPAAPPPAAAGPLAPTATAPKGKSSVVGWLIWGAVGAGVVYLLWRSSRTEAEEARALETEIARLQASIQAGGGSVPGREPAPSVVVVTPPPILGATFGPFARPG